ncbi:MFS transporter [Microbacterium sp. cx-55]|uniref:MFS transporter n=1 Tax=unclassified Microbacterium TaxID=2609290 RepID=UPI001CBAA93D|nr:MULTISPECIES: MFS transporter [unclassified Microbacterium]MBZ4488559.1 MFS transporter [Microbacterium sp. cx-55]MCC4909700.1 MFS transporter [Microbacterium sp. cx-59]UGB36140.1 MFS transporter [Microbacterium sp. cx-55]
MDTARRTDRVVLTVAILASFVSFLDATVVNVALPAIERDVGGGLATQQWVVDAYLLTLGAFILVAGSLSDVFGRVRILRVGLVLFGVASLAIAASSDPLTLNLLRGVQGIGGALLVPSSLALITAQFQDAARARAIGIWTGATTVATLVGPVAGGLFVDLLSWRWVFVINALPIALTLVLLARGGLRDERVPGARIDIPGAALCTLGLGGTVFALIEQPRLGWSSPAVWLTAVIGIAALIGFVFRQRVAASPLMPLSLFRARNFWAGNLTTFFVYGALSLNGLVLALYLQEGAGLSATESGLASLPATLLMILFSSRIGGLAGRFGPRLFMTLGPVIMSMGMLYFLFVGEDFNYLTQVLPGILLFGAGLTLTVAPLTAAVLGAVPTDRSGIASAVNNAVSRVAGLVAVALLGVVVAGDLDLDGFHAVAIVTAALMAAGAVASFFGIRNTTASASPAPAQS